MPFECAIVGDGEERRGLERLIRSPGPPRPDRITGFLAQEDLVPLYQQAGVVTLPALSESHFGIPNILLEALAVETPVICTALPSLSEFMEDGVHGLFVPEQSPKALADAIGGPRPRPRAGPGHRCGGAPADRGALRCQEERRCARSTCFAPR